MNSIHRLTLFLLFYLLHCLPGQWKVKKKVIENISKNINGTGCFIWCTILGADVEPQFFGNKLMSVYNKKVFLVTILTRQML